MRSSALVEVLEGDRPEDVQRWNALAEASPLCDVGFRPGFVRAHQLYPEASTRALVVNAKGRRFLIPLLFRYMEDRGWFDTHTASNLGGILPLEAGDLDASTAAELVKALSEWSRGEKVAAHIITLHPAFGQREAFDTDAVQAQGGYRLDRLKQAAIDLSSWDDENDAPPRIKWERRRDLKRARAELRMEWLSIEIQGEELPRELQIFIELYRKTLARLSAHEHFYYPERYFRTLLGEMPRQISIALIRRGEEPVGVASMLHDHQFAHGHLMGVSEEGRKLGAATWVYVECARRARSLGCRLLYIGGGMEEGDSLWHFKSSFRPLEFIDSQVIIAPDPAMYQSLREDSGDSAFAYPPLERPAQRTG